MGVDGSVRCWGSSDRGQLGDPSIPVFDREDESLVTHAPTPVVAQGVTGATTVDAGWSHTCASRDDGSVVCWGENAEGQLGNGEVGTGLDGAPRSAYSYEPRSVVLPTP